MEIKLINTLLNFNQFLLLFLGADFFVDESTDEVLHCKLNQKNHRSDIDEYFISTVEKTTNIYSVPSTVLNKKVFVTRMLLLLCYVSEQGDHNYCSPRKCIHAINIDAVLI